MSPMQTPSTKSICGFKVLKQQQGAALLLFAVLLLVVSTTAFFTYFDSAQFRKLQDNKTAEVLVIAKEALMGRALTDLERPGSLPCPDNTGNGSSELFAGNHCPSYVGWFPWRTLGTGELLDGNGDRLWYALSRNHRDHPSAQPLNMDTIGSLSLDGVGDHVAIIFSPGMPMNGQNRPSNQVQHYLDGENANGDDLYTRLIQANLNDRTLTITRGEIMQKVAMRLLGTVKGSELEGLLAYYATAGEIRYPFADANGDGYAEEDALNGIPSYQGHADASLMFSPTTLTMLGNNEWLPLIEYQVTADGQQVTLALGGQVLVVTP